MPRSMKGCTDSSGGLDARDDHVNGVQTRDDIGSYNSKFRVVNYDDLLFLNARQKSD